MTPVNPIVVTTSPFFLLPENKNDLPPRIDTYKRVDDLYKVYKSNVHCMDNWTMRCKSLSVPNLHLETLRTGLSFM